MSSKTFSELNDMELTALWLYFTEAGRKSAAKESAMAQQQGVVEACTGYALCRVLHGPEVSKSGVC